MRRLMSVLVALILVLGGGLVAPPLTRAADQACFPETGQCIQGRFLDYWQAHGGLAVNGYPLTGERQEILEDSKVYTVQYFERVRMEYHPENPPPWDVELGQFGRRVLRERFRGDAVGYQNATKPVAPVAGQSYFPVTGHNVDARFFAYWQANGGLAQFGYPLTEAFDEWNVIPGQQLHVQYFERARFEYHPENPAPYDVELGQFGRDILAEVDLLRGNPDFFALYTSDEAVRGQLGRPKAAAVTVPGATEAFERGRMLWRGDKRQIFALCGDPQAGHLQTSGSLPYFDDTWMAGQDPGGGQGPRAGLYYPVRGFGKVWRTYSPVQQCLGYATSAQDTGYTMTAQDFERGWLLTADTPGGRFIYAITYFYRCNGCSAEGGYTRFAPPVP